MKAEKTSLLCASPSWIICFRGYHLFPLEKEKKKNILVT